MQTVTPAPFGWMSSHWVQITGLSFVLTFFYRGYILVRKLAGYGESIDSTRESVNLLMTNHLPHIQAELKEVNQNLIGLREDMKDNFGQLRSDLRALLVKRD